MKKIILYVVAMMLSSPSTAELKNSIPLWDQTNNLICSGLSRFQCQETGCDKGDSTALWKFDFPNRKILSLSTYESEYSIGAKYFKYWDHESSAHIIFLDGRIFDFDMDRDLSSGIYASLVGNYWDEKNIEISSMKFRCHPD